MRKALGMDLNTSVEDAIEVYSIMANFLSIGTPKKQKISKELKLRNNLVNDEYYIDSMIQEAIELGYKCKVFEVEHYICWGTPDELRTYNYWSSCFDKSKNHNFKNFG